MGGPTLHANRGGRFRPRTSGGEDVFGDIRVRLRANPRGRVANARRSALTPSRIFYLLPHQIRRSSAALIVPGRFKELQDLRRADISAEGSLRPFDEHRCIFVHVPKAAGVSISKGLFGCLGGSHMDIGLYQVVYSKREFDDYFKFTFVRNPWDRLLSAYSFLRSGGMHEADKRWAQANIVGYPTFEDFVLNWVSEENVLTYVHFVPQYRFVCAPFSRDLLVDFVGHYEHLARDFEYVRSRLDLDGVDLPHHNGGPEATRRADFRHHYTSEMRRVVERVYQVDLDLFGYSFPP